MQRGGWGRADGEPPVTLRLTAAHWGSLRSIPGMPRVRGGDPCKIEESLHACRLWVRVVMRRAVGRMRMRCAGIRFNANNYTLERRRFAARVKIAAHEDIALGVVHRRVARLN